MYECLSMGYLSKETGLDEHTILARTSHTLQKLGVTLSWSTLTLPQYNLVRSILDAEFAVEIVSHQALHGEQTREGSRAFLRRFIRTHEVNGKRTTEIQDMLPTGAYLGRKVVADVMREEGYLSMRQSTDTGDGTKQQIRYWFSEKRYLEIAEMQARREKERQEQNRVLRVMHNSEVSFM